MNPEIPEDEETPKETAPRASESIETKLLEARTILVEGPVNDRLYHYVVGRLYFLEAKDPKGGILMVINSPGGSADSGF
ncbi:MAG: ATP-dependent Clp protease proteolytic subunit, partial [Planctomycetota bacterium]|nr:ATP-dependent Clp protease proteolytic subunit [Planctomycetota bacterium]